MAKKKKFFEKKSTNKAILISLMVALVLMAINALRFAISFIIKNSFTDPRFVGAVESVSYLASFFVAVVILIFLINYFSTLVDK